MRGKSEKTKIRRQIYKESKKGKNRKTKKQKIKKGKQKIEKTNSKGINIQRKTSTSTTSHAINVTRTGLGMNPGLRGERPATNHLSRGYKHLMHMAYQRQRNETDALRPTTVCRCYVQHFHTILHSRSETEESSEEDLRYKLFRL